MQLEVKQPTCATKCQSPSMGLQQAIHAMPGEFLVKWLKFSSTPQHPIGTFKEIIATCDELLSVMTKLCLPHCIAWKEPTAVSFLQVSDRQGSVAAEASLELALESCDSEVSVSSKNNVQPSQPASPTIMEHETHQHMS